MNRHNLTRTIFGAALLFAFAACTQDELTDGNVTSLPEGKYPLEIGSISLAAEVDEQPWRAGVPQTRVTESDDRNSSAWEWNGTERIGVQLYADGDVATYTLNSGKTLTPDKTLYWKDTQQTTVTAWYPAYTGESGTVSLADQNSGLAYVLKGSGTGTYDAPVTLNFTHALAKVRVVLNGNEADKAKVEDVKIWSHTNGTHTKGNISGSNEGWITMMKVARGTETVWEANVVPGKTIEKFQVNGTTNGTLTTSVTPEAGKWHEITINVEGPVTNIDLSSGNVTISENGNYRITGDNPERELTIKSPDGWRVPIENTIILENTTLKSIKLTESGHEGYTYSTFIIKGTVTVTQGIIAHSGGEIKIKGTTGSKLIITNPDSYNPAIGNLNNYARNVTLTIEDATIEATGAEGAAAIGTSSGWPGNGNVGDITIKNSDLTLNAVSGGYMGNPAVIGTGVTDGATLSCGNITIYLKDGQSKEQFLQNLKGDYNQQVGVGSNKAGGSVSCGSINWYNSDGSPVN